MNKSYIITAIALMILQGCITSGTGLTPASQPANIETSDVPIDEAALIDSIDQYVNTIRESGDLFDFRRTNSKNGQAVVCLLDGNVVKVSILENSGRNTDYYIRGSRPVFMLRNVLFDVDSSYIESAYYVDGKLYKYFCDGSEITDKATVDHISLLTHDDLAATF